MDLRLAGFQYRVRGAPVSWCYELPEKLRDCQSPASEEPLRTIQVRLSNRPDLSPVKRPQLGAGGMTASTSGQKTTFRYAWCELCFVSCDQSEVLVDVDVGSGPWFGGILETVLRILVAYDTLNAGGVLLHSAAVVSQGQAAVLFGHSGAGKSTASAIALQHGCRVISDDINVLIREKEAWVVLPVPFSGAFTASSEVRGPVQVSGLFRLRQSDHDETRPSSLANSVSVLAGSAPFINQDPGRLERLMDVLAQLANEIPVRDLHFSRGARFLEHVFPMISEGEVHR